MLAGYANRCALPVQEVTRFYNGALNTDNIRQARLMAASNEMTEGIA